MSLSDTRAQPAHCYYSRCDFLLFLGVINNIFGVIVLVVVDQDDKCAGGRLPDETIDCLIFNMDTPQNVNDEGI